MALKINGRLAQAMKTYMDPEGFIPTRETDTAEDWGFDRDSREWMLFVKNSVEALRSHRRYRS